MAAELKKLNITSGKSRLKASAKSSDVGKKRHARGLDKATMSAKATKKDHSRNAGSKVKRGSKASSRQSEEEVEAESEEESEVEEGDDVGSDGEEREGMEEERKTENDGGDDESSESEDEEGEEGGYTGYQGVSLGNGQGLKRTRTSDRDSHDNDSPKAARKKAAVVEPIEEVSSF